MTPNSLPLVLLPASPSGSLTDLVAKLLEYVTNCGGFAHRSQNRNCPHISHRRLGGRGYII